ncbi:MAG: hypothetical protein ABSD47_10195 [Candidatus Methylomirabilota bacterium]|jgi:uncharacterized protein YwgA
MTEIGRRELLLLLIGLGEGKAPTASVSGITRLQKLLFLLEQEGHIQPKGEGFAFEPYKAGPYSSRLYDDLELLENLGLIRSEATAESTLTETVEIDRLSFEDLMGGFEGRDGGSRAVDSLEERRFTLTSEGKKRAERLLATGEYQPVVEGIRKVKSTYSHYSLRDLLRYVYQKYPEMTTESEIINEVLGRRGK